MPGPRDYKRSTIFALAALGQGTCYWPKPQCRVPLLVYIDGQPVTNLEIAHICAAESNGPRHDEGMTDDERRSWPNLILLCTPHHLMIDKIKPLDYSIEDLRGWKSSRETGKLAGLSSDRDLTADRMQELLAESRQAALSEVRTMLKEHQPIDSDAAMLLAQVARDLVPTLDEGNVTMLSDGGVRSYPYVG